MALYIWIQFLDPMLTISTFEKTGLLDSSSDCYFDLIKTQPKQNKYWDGDAFFIWDDWLRIPSRLFSIAISLSATITTIANIINQMNTTFTIDIFFGIAFFVSYTQLCFLWAIFLMLFSGIPHLPTFCHVVCVTYVTSHVSRASRMSRVKCRVR